MNAECDINVIEYQGPQSVNASGTLVCQVTLVKIIWRA